MQADGVLVRFGEIGIKSAPVRRHMVQLLRRNLLDGLLRAKVEGDVQVLGARLWMAGPDASALMRVATHTFGVVSVSPARVVAATMDEMGKAASTLALAAGPWSSFAVRASREGKHGFTSQDIGIQVGSAVHQAATAAGRTPRVDLDMPDLEVHVDVRQDKAFVFTRSEPGPGGIPAGAQGRVVALVSDANSIVSAWLMARRGCDVLPYHGGTQRPALSARLDAWGLPPAELLPGGDKAALLQQAAAVARRRRATAVVTGETLSSVFAPCDVPVLRPVCGLDAGEVRSLRRIIGLPEDA